MTVIPLHDGRHLTEGQIVRILDDVNGASKGDRGRLTRLTVTAFGHGHGVVEVWPDRPPVTVRAQYLVPVACGRHKEAAA